MDRRRSSATVSSLTTTPHLSPVIHHCTLYCLVCHSIHPSIHPPLLVHLPSLPPSFPPSLRPSLPLVSRSRSFSLPPPILAMSTVSLSAFLTAVAAVQSSGAVRVESSCPLLSSPPPSSASDSISRADLPVPVVLVPTAPERWTLREATEWVTSCQSRWSCCCSTRAASSSVTSLPLRPRTSRTSSTPSRAGRDLPYEDSLSYAVRLRVCRRVCTTNEGKRGGLVFPPRVGAGEDVAVQAAVLL